MERQRVAHRRGRGTQESREQDVELTRTRVREREHRDDESMGIYGFRAALERARSERAPESAQSPHPRTLSAPQPDWRESMCLRW